MSELATRETVLDVKNLQTVFFTNSGLFRAVDDVSFNVSRGETLAIVGESGCGKSVSALSIMRLVPNPPGRIVGGSILLEGVDLLDLDEATMRGGRGNTRPLRGCACVAGSARNRLGIRRSRCCAWCAFPSRRGGRRNIRTSSPAACA